MDRVAASLVVTPEQIEAHEVWVLEDADLRVLGFLRVVLGEPAVLEDLWLEPDLKGRGLGRRMFERALSIASDGGASAVELDAEPFAEGFYERMGAERIGFTESAVVPGRRLPRMRIELTAR